MRPAFDQSNDLIRMPAHQKAACTNDLYFSGYTPSGEETTDCVPDYNEVFKITLNHSLHDRRVVDRWPCHGPCTWPDEAMRAVMADYIDLLGDIGERFLQALSYGLRLKSTESLSKLTSDRWHHMRVNRYPLHRAVDEGRTGAAGIRPHTDHGSYVRAMFITTRRKTSAS